MSGTGARKSTSKGAPRANRPALPTDSANTLLSGGSKNPVRTQTLNLDNGVYINIARVKVPVPRGVSGHVIKRFDTNAISASTMFRVAYPLSSSESERDELAWVAEAYDTFAAGNEKDTRSRLTGVWVPLDAASKLAEDYGITTFVEDLFKFEFPEDVSETSSPQTAAAAATTTTTNNTDATTTTSTTANKQKRQRVSSSSPALEKPASKGQEKTGSASAKSPPKAKEQQQQKESPAKSSSAKSSPAKETQQPTPSPKKDVAPPSPSSSTKGSPEASPVATTKVNGVQKEKETAATASTKKDQKQRTAEEIEAEINENKKLVENIKEEKSKETKSKASSAPSQKGKRSRANVENDNEDSDTEENLSFWQRTLGRRRTRVDPATNTIETAAAPRRISPLRRQLAAVAGVAIVGAASYAAPYFLG